ncbi:UDP-glucuronosyltransferase 2A1-like isoform X2 [Anabas testudineus]|uniref:UDP-glucuronosyltransferase 2A1-like isoform X2 n=1 Tax=Anabas testudineus TaxID=64144 RepID=UPI000E459A53|nr:UDP-glucuronosyltransferase 2A1-like isoform X2 [Anabas testudineus]
MMQVFPPLFLPALLLVLAPSCLVDGGHVLVFPGEYSHWLNMRTIMEELVRRKHSVTILVPDASPSINYNSSVDAAKFNFLVFKVPFSRAEFHGVTQEFIHFSMYELHLLSPLHKFWRIRGWMQQLFDLGMQQCDSMLKNKQLMATLREAAFDAVLLDPMVMCGDLVADVLGLPLILSLRFSFGSVMERHCGHAPAQPSYVPAAPLPYGDLMSFRERLINTVMYVGTSVVSEVVWKLTLDQYYSKVKGSPSSICESLGKADIWLIRTFWDLETPRPTPPNFQYVGGLHCKPANQLPDDLEAFVQSSGDAGVVVVTFGSMVTNLTTERADVIAAAFGRIPQKVIWRYSGETPRTLAANTKLCDWIPQNDLLGHPKTRAFVTHGGTNGLYEAVYHGVPLVGVPLFGDQSDNLARLSRRGGAIVLNFNQLTVDELTETLNTVIDQPRSSMQHLSALHRDRPESPLSTAVFWVEFVMRHGGAHHLRLASRDLNWFQYHSVDTVTTLLVVLMGTIAAFWESVLCLLRRCRRRRVGREKND